MYRSMAFLVVLTLPAAASGIEFKGSDTAVCIQRVDTDGDFNGGSGNCIEYDAAKDESFILTAAHVAPDGGKKINVIHKGKDYAASYVTGSKVTEVQDAEGNWTLTIDGPDLAIIKVKGKLPVAKLSNKPVEVGDQVFFFGFPGGRHVNGPYVKVGEVTTLDIWTSGDARPGDSGACLFNEAGFIVGVIHSRPQDRDEPAGLALPLDTVKDFLKASKGKSKPLPLPQRPLRPKCPT